MADLKRVRIGTDIHLYPTIEEAGLDVAWSRVETIKPYIFSDTLRCPIGQCSYSVSEDGMELDVLFPASAQFFVGSYGENVCRLVMLVTIDGKESTYDMPAFVLVPLGDMKDIDDGDQSIRINLDRWSFGGASNPVDPEYVWSLLRADGDEQIDASHIREAIEQSGVLDLDNNYLNGVSGSGNGTMTFSRQGLPSLSFDAKHRHGVDDINGLYAALDGRYVRIDNPATLRYLLTTLGGLRIGDGSGRFADLYYRDGQLVIDGDVYISGSLDGTDIGEDFDEATMWRTLGTSIYEKKIPAEYLDVETGGGGGSSDVAAALGNAGGRYNIGSEVVPVYFKNGLPVAVVGITLPDGIVTVKSIKLGNNELTTDDKGDLIIKGNVYTTGWFGVTGRGEEGGGDTPGSLPIASATVLGGIKVGANLSIDENGVLSATGGGGGITWSDLGTTSTSKKIAGSYIKLTSGGGLSYDSEFYGLGLEPATASALGGIKVGSGLSITKGGVLSVTGGGGGGSDPYELPIASSSTLGGIKVGSGLSINSSTGVLSVTGGGGDPYTLPKASTTQLGGIIVGSGLSINSNGVLSATGGGGTSGITEVYADSRYIRRDGTNEADETITFIKGIRIGSASNGVDITYDSTSGALLIDGDAYTSGWLGVTGPGEEGGGSGDVDIITSLSASSTNNQVLGAKALYNLLGDLESALMNLL